MASAIALNQPITSAQAQAAQRELRAMRRALQGWLHYRNLNDRGARGEAQRALLRRPGAAALLTTGELKQDRQAREAKLALNLHRLLSEVFGPEGLPDPDVARNPEAAVQLALIACAGKLPGDAKTPGAVGFIWLWPVVIVVGAIAYVISSKIRNDAETAQEHERLECIKAGYCTDYGFWLKVGAVGFVGWLVWDRLGVGARVTGSLKRKGGRR